MIEATEIKSLVEIKTLLVQFEEAFNPGLESSFQAHINGEDIYDVQGLIRKQGFRFEKPFRRWVKANSKLIWRIQRQGDDYILMGRRRFDKVTESVQKQ
jgi:hypothetical protein